MTQYSLNDEKKSKLIVISLWLVYASAYFARTCYSASIASIVSDGMFQKGEIGLVGTAFFVCYGAGQIVNGIVGDKVNPFALVLCGSFGSGICCLTMGLTRSLVSMAVIWGFNGLFQSMLWSPLLRIFSEIINEKLRKKAVLNIALSLPVGTVAAYLLSGVLIKYYGWKSMFFAASAVVMIIFLIALSTVLISKRSIIKICVNKSDLKISNKSDGRHGFLKLAVSSGLLIILVPSFLHGMMRDGIANWVPTMITEIYRKSPSFSSTITVVLPIFNAFGAYAVTPIYRKFKEDEMKTSVVCAAFSLIPMSLLLMMKNLPIYISVVLLAIITASMYALNYLIISRVSVRFSKSGHTSSVTGILNSFAYIGCAVSSYGFGAVSEKFGWNTVVLIWIASSFLLLIFSFIADKKWKKFMLETTV
ncbi:MAG: MFS transporter [Clostridia bacterium]|nr:MFS transporter [Clostridia bacterium]